MDLPSRYQNSTLIISSRTWGWWTSLSTLKSQPDCYKCLLSLSALFCVETRLGEVCRSVKTLTNERMQHYARALREKGGAAPGVWGFIDGTSRGTCRPKYNQRFYYSGYKKEHGFKYQGIVTPDGLVLSLVEPFEANINDANMYIVSQMPERLQRMFQGKDDLYLYGHGDSTYESCYRVLTPFKDFGGLTSEQRAFNDWLSSDRISVEQAFGIVQNLWHANALTVDLKPILQSVGAWYWFIMISAVSCYCV